MAQFKELQRGAGTLERGGAMRCTFAPRELRCSMRFSPRSPPSVAAITALSSVACCFCLLFWLPAYTTDTFTRSLTPDASPQIRSLVRTFHRLLTT